MDVEKSGADSAGFDSELYVQFKTLEKQLEFLDIQVSLCSGVCDLVRLEAESCVVPLALPAALGSVHQG